MSNLEQAREARAAVQKTLTEADAELALAVCNEIKRLTEEAGRALEPVKELIKELPLKHSLDNSERRRDATKFMEDITVRLGDLRALASQIQAGWQEDAR